MEPALQPRPPMEGESLECRRDDENKRTQIARKPVPVRTPEVLQSEKQLLDSGNECGDGATDYLSYNISRLDLEVGAPALPPRPRPVFRDTATLTCNSGPYIAEIDQAVTSGSYSAVDSPSIASKPILSPTTSFSTAATYTQKAYREVRHFAGGLIHHPSQSTKHYSILRHSHGLIFYQGPGNTTLALSIFADRPLPQDRTLWMQSKGWTGNAGLRAGAALAAWNSTGRWIDVTPATRVVADELQPADERAWQRDIAKFAKRIAKDKRARHELRETMIVQIPAEARDGYYRVVLCMGVAEGVAAGSKRKKVLCPSPVFRVLSTSTSPGSVRGASLTTLPLEVGAMFLSSAAKTAARTASGNAIGRVNAVVQQQIQPYKPSWGMQTAAKAAYSISGASKKIDSNVKNANELYDQKSSEDLRDFTNEIFPEDGPRAPFPIEFVGSAVCKSSIVEDLDVPVIYLNDIPENITKRLDGYYFGWVRPCSKEGEKRSPAEPDDIWQKAIISAILRDPINFSPIVEKDQLSIAIYIIQDGEETALLDFILQVQVMGFIRPADQFTGKSRSSEKLDDTREAEAEDALLSAINDIEIAQSFLDHPSWTPRTSLSQRGSSRLKPLQKITSSYADTRLSLQKQIDRVPFHKAGIRMPSHAIKGRETNIGGVYVIR